MAQLIVELPRRAVATTAAAVTTPFKPLLPDHSVDEWGRDDHLVRLLWPLARLRWNVSVGGLEHLPARTGALLVTNERRWSSSPLYVAGRCRTPPADRCASSAVPTTPRSVLHCVASARCWTTRRGARGAPPRRARRHGRRGHQPSAPRRHRRPRARRRRRHRRGAGHPGRVDEQPVQPHRPRRGRPAGAPAPQAARAARRDRDRRGRCSGTCSASSTSSAACRPACAIDWLGEG
jgi:hypothetical protein